MMQNAGVLYILTCKCHSGVPFFDNFSTSALQKVARDRQFFTILTWKCASRYSGVQFFHIATSKSGPNLTCFAHFDLKMCFSPHRRAIFPHRNFKKWSEPDMFCTFWLENVLLAAAACDFSTSQLQKVVRTWHVLYILTSKCASRYSGVQFFLCPLQSYLRTRRFSEVTFRPSRHTKHWKTQHFATSLTFRACWSSFFPHLLIFFLAALLFQLSILSEVRLLNFLRSWSRLGLKDCKSRPANQLDESTVHPSLPGISDVYAALPRPRAGRIEEQASGQLRQQNNHKDWIEKFKKWNNSQYLTFRTRKLMNSIIGGQPRGLRDTMVPSATSSMWTMHPDPALFNCSPFAREVSISDMLVCEQIFDLLNLQVLYFSYAWLSQIVFQLLCVFSVRFWFDAHRASKDRIDIFRDSWFGAMIAMQWPVNS